MSCDFTRGKCDAIKGPSGATVEYTGDGAVFSISSEGNAPTVSSEKYIFFGRVDVEVQAAHGDGIISSIVLQSDDLDEIDWEWVGNNDTQVQTNYFRKGDDGTYNRGASYEVNKATTSAHKYSIDWNPNSITWLIDGTSVRTLNAADAGGKYPQTPMMIKLGTWAPTSKNGAQPGTIKWAGGPPDFAKGPFHAYYKSISITDYAGGSTATDKIIKEYAYSDKSGKASSVTVKLGEGDSDSSSTDSSTQDHSSTKPFSSKTTAATSTGGHGVTNGTQIAKTSNAGTTGTTGISKPTEVSSGHQNIVAIGDIALCAVAAALLL